MQIGIQNWNGECEAIPAIKYGVDSPFGLTEQETVMFTASHRGEPFHVQAVEAIIEKLGLREDQLLCSPTYPNNVDAWTVLCQEKSPRRRVYHNCAGKHLLEAVFKSKSIVLVAVGLRLYT